MEFETFEEYNAVVQSLSPSARALHLNWLALPWSYEELVRDHPGSEVFLQELREAGLIEQESEVSL